MDIAKTNYLKYGPYLELMAGLRTALNVNEGIIKLVGQEGAGKTAICRQLAAELRAAHGDVIFFETPPESSDYLYQRIQSELGLTPDKNFNSALTRYLQAKSPPNNKLVIIYDDAEKISRDIFILIRLLNNIHGHSETLVSQIICGTRKLDRIFDDPDLRSLTQYLNQSFTLEPMTREELEDFHAGYRKEKGLTLQTLSNKTLTEIFISGKGLPGKTLEMFDRYYQPRTALPGEANADPAGSVTPAGSTAVPATAQEAAGEVSLATAYAREVDAILEEEAYRPGRFPLYFKAALSATVILVTLVLAFVLSGDNARNPDQLAAILDDDSPLYLDEVEARTTETAAVPAQAEAAPAGNETPPRDTGDDAMADAAGTQTDLPLAIPVQTRADQIAEAPDAAAIGEATGAAEEALVPASTPEVGEPAPDAVTTAAVADGQGQQLQETGAGEPAVSKDMLAEVITSWADAWEAGDFTSYLAAYGDGFMTGPDDDRTTWETQRRNRIDGVTGIRIEFDRFEITAADATQATVRFWLYYSRGNYADETLKEIRLQRESGRWLITDERNLEVVTR